MDTSRNMDEIYQDRNFLTDVIVRVDFASPIWDVGETLPKQIGAELAC